MSDSKRPDDSEETRTASGGSRKPDVPVTEAPFGPDAGGERFELGEDIGEGGMATVVEARDARLDRIVAVKCIKPDLGSIAEQRQRFVREAHILAGLGHPGTVPVHDAGVLADNRLYYAMARVQGKTLGELLRERTNDEIRDRAGILHFVDIFERVCQTTAFAHSKGIVHRDLKPGNVMVDEFGAVFVMDWGLAKHVPTDEHPFLDDSVTRHGDLVGTPGYISPERARTGEEDVDPQTDVFALGVVLYTILTGIKPFTGKTSRQVLEEVLYHDPKPPRSVNSTVSRELSAICMKALAKDPRERYASAAELAEDVRKHREFLPVSAVRPRWIDRFGNWTRRNKVVAAVLATLLVAILGLGALLGLRVYFVRQQIEGLLQRAEVIADEIESLQPALEKSRAGVASGSLDRKALEELEARWVVKQLNLRGLLAAAIGIRKNPDPRALAMGRRHTMQLAQNLMDAEEYWTAAAFTELVVERSLEGNVLGFSAEEIALLRDVHARAEARLDRLD